MLIRRRPRKSFEDTLYDTLMDGHARLVAKGVAPDEAMATVREAYAKSLDEMAPRLAQRLTRRAPRMLRRDRRTVRRFHRRLRKHWGGPLDQYRTIVVCVEEIARQFDDDHGRVAAASGDALYDALSGLTARACRTALEVHHLLSGGFGMGALARCRTLHELAVYGSVLTEYGRRDEHRDLAERFLDHHHVLNAFDATSFNKHSAALGEAVLSGEDMQWIEGSRDALVEKYGKDYTGDCGWAAGLAGNRKPRFVDLEALADLSHLRSYYRWAGHEVHADAKGWQLNVREHRGTAYQSTGQELDGLADPAVLALGSLMQTFIALMYCRGETLPEEQLSMVTMQHMADRAAEAFINAHLDMEESQP